MQGLSQEAATQLPHIRSIRRGIRRERQSNAPATPADRSSIEIPEEYKRLTSGEQFLQYDSGPLQLLVSSNHWFMDGTFKIVPQLFFQLYTVHVLHNGGTVPCVYALLPRKEEATYEHLFREIKSLAPQAAPSSIMLDFEKAAINAAGRIFTGAEIKCCFFHLSQNIFRQVQENGLQNRYRDDAEFALGVRMVAATAFVPVDQIVDAYEQLQ